MDFKYKKEGTQGYWVSLHGEQIGFVRAAWRKIHGGDCWSVEYQDRTEYFGTRKAAAAHLAQYRANTDTKGE